MGSDAPGADLPRPSEAFRGLARSFETVPRRARTARLPSPRCAFLAVNLALPQLRQLRSLPTRLWPCLILIGLCRGVGGNSAFPSISLMLNSQLTEHLGAPLAPLQPLWRCTPLAPLAPFLTASDKPRCRRDERLRPLGLRSG